MNFSTESSTINSTLESYFPGEIYFLRLISKVQAYFLDVSPITFVFGSVWNSLIIIYFMKVHRKKLVKMNSYHFLNINLAVTDLFVTVGAPIFASNFYKRSSWELGDFGCRFFFPFFAKVCPTVSCWLLVLISYARYRSIVHPLRAKINKMKYCLVCIWLWVLGILSNIYLFMNVALKERRSMTVCAFTGKYQHNIIYQAVNYVLESFLPLGIMLSLYYRMKRTMTAQERENPFLLSERIRQRNQTALKTIRGLIFLFAATTVPVRICNIFILTISLLSYHSDLNFYRIYSRYFLLVFFFSKFVFYLNNALNIFIYAKMIPGFREFLWPVITFGCRKRRNAANE